MNKSLTYRDAGVDIDAGNQSVDAIKSVVKSTYRDEVLGDLGGFGALFQLDATRYQQPVLVSGTDGVGTKLQIAFMMKNHTTIGQDVVAMCVNDILAQGAEPLFFLDYLAVGKLEPTQITDIVTGIASACKASGCALIGGETAEMAGFYKPGEYDVAGFCVGIVEKSAILPKNTIVEGDVLIGLASSGLHSNGYSLVRKICFEHQKLTVDTWIPALNRTLGDELLTPTRLYPKSVLPLMQANRIKGAVHITGGGFYDNIPRVLPHHLSTKIHRDAWAIPPIFTLLQQWGNVRDAEMFRTFNMGIGMVLVAAPTDVDAILSHLGQDACVIGEVIAGDHNVVIEGVNT